MRSLISIRLHMPNAWADVPTAFNDHHLWSIQGTWELLMPEIKTVQRAQTAVAHLENQILAKAAILI